MTTAGSWPCRSSSAEYYTSCSPRRPDPADPPHEPADADLVTEREWSPENSGEIRRSARYRPLAVWPLMACRSGRSGVPAGSRIALSPVWSDAGERLDEGVL